MKPPRRSRTIRTLFTAAAFAVLAATSGVPAAHAAPRHAAARADERSWLEDLNDFDAAPRPAGSFAPWWSSRAEAAPSSYARTSATVPTGPQTDAILAYPDTTYYYAGHAVSISGSNVLAASNINSASLGGVVYLYHNVDTATGTVTQATRLAAADGYSGDAGENYGVSVAIQGGLGLVGANMNSNSGGNFTPSVYVFRGLDTATGATVNESAILRPTDSASSAVLYGSAVSLAGNTGLVGSYNNVSGGLSTGEAYVYRNLNTATGTVTENARLLPSDGASGGRFGYATGLSGNLGLVGAYNATVGSNTGQGAAYVFRNLDTATGTITQNAKLVASDGAASNFFGFAVSESGNTALVGAYRATVGSNAVQGAAYVFRNLDTATGTVTQNVKLFASDGAANDSFGIGVALSGNTALVGSNRATINGNTQAGAAYLYTNLDTASGTVTQNVKLFATGGAASAYFGFAVALDGDGFVIGAYGANSIRGQSYNGSVGSLTTLDLGSTSKIISGISFVSQDNWIVGQNTSGNQVTLSAGDTATVNATGKGVFIGQNVGSNNNTLVLTGTVNANTFTIGATGNSGNTLQLGVGGTTGSLPTGATIINNGALAFNRSNAVVQGTDFTATPLTGTGGITQLGTGTTTLNAANTFTGPTTVNAGTLALTGANLYNAGTSAGAITINGGTLLLGGNDTFGNAASQSPVTVTINAGGNLTDSQTFNTLYALTLNGGTLTASGRTDGIGAFAFSGTVTATGTTTSNIVGTGASQDYIRLGADNSTGAVSATAFNVNNAAGNLNIAVSLANNFGNTGALVKTGAGTLTLTAGNTYTGGTTFAGGAVNVANVGALGSTGTLSFTGGALQYSAANQTDYSNRFSTAAGQLYSIDTNGQNVTFATTVASVGGSLTKTGAGTLTLNAANTYTGTTTVNGGTLRAGVATVPGTSGAFGANSALSMANVAGATLDLNNFNTQIGSLTGGGTTGGNVTLGTATLTVGANNTSPAAYAGAISGTGGLTKIGTGTQTLSGTSNYSGPTAINGGMLAVNGSLTGIGILTAANGTTLAGRGTVAGAVTVQAGGTFSPGQSGTGRLTLGNTLTLTGTATAAFTLGGTTVVTQYTQAAVTGAVNLGTTATLSLSLASGFTPTAGTKFYLLDETGVQAAVLGTFANAPTTGSQFTQSGFIYQINYLDRDPADTSNALLNDVSVTVVGAVPEPSTWAFVAAGAALLGVGVLRRQRGA